MTALEDLMAGASVGELTASGVATVEYVQTRIRMAVHPVVPRSLKHYNSSFHGLDRTDNLSKAHR